MNNFNKDRFVEFQRMLEACAEILLLFFARADS